MSAHIKCTCGRSRGDVSDLVVVQRNYSRSAFNGYRKLPSDFSLVWCTRLGCQGAWRTKAKYVDKLPDWNGE